VQAAAKFYREVLDAEVWELESAEAAELAKLAETTYRDLNIAFANELARFSSEWGVDVVQVIEAANSQPYSHIHRPGIGVGGHCIPHYPHLLQDSTSGSELVRVAREINVAMPGRAVELLQSALGDIDGKTVVLLGLAYRGGVKESADSPTFPLVELLSARGAVVSVDDPLYSADEIARFGFDAWDGRPPDAFVLVTDHREYREFAWKSYAPTVLIDGRNALVRDEMTALGHMYLGIGR